MDDSILKSVLACLLPKRWCFLRTSFPFPESRIVALISPLLADSSEKSTSSPHAALNDRPCAAKNTTLYIICLRISLCSSSNSILLLIRPLSTRSQDC